MIIIRLLKLTVFLTVELFFIICFSAGPLDYHTLLVEEYEVIRDYFGTDGVYSFFLLCDLGHEQKSLFSLLAYLGLADYFQVVIIRLFCVPVALYKQFLCLSVTVYIIAVFYKKQCFALHIPTLMTKLFICNLYQFSLVVMTFLCIQRYGPSAVYMIIFMALFSVLLSIRLVLSTGGSAL
ncbi:MAG: hypothetical protein J6M93_05560 [Succinivibrio sp.]|nr:hypothetical protein [Succinivibrio sp.]